MKKLSKEIYKRIQNGEHSGLIVGIEELIDMFNNKPWEEGYASAIEDLSVRSYRLAEHIKNTASLIGHKPRKGENVYVIEVDDLAEAIEEYFQNALKS